MASSFPSSLCKHDVFLSFQGDDTRHNIVTHLYNALQSENIQTFRDYGPILDEISPEVIRGIEGCMISVIIFSKNYADSEWCLDELVKILECRAALKQIVIPVFYKVDPTHVQNQTGKFGSAFDRLLKNIAASKSGKEQIWRDALKEAASLSGFVLFNYGSEFILVKTIVDKILKIKALTPSECQTTFFETEGEKSDHTVVGTDE